MSKILTELLGVDETKFRSYIERLEHVSLRPGVDVRLGVEIVAKTRAMVKALGLDAQDTTARELFFALKHKLAADDTQLKIKLKLKTGEIERNTEKIAQAAETASRGEISLSLTTAGTKRILKAVPPKRTLKLLKYRSLDSVIKRQDPRILYALACEIENDSWHAQVQAKIKRLNAKDIQWQRVSCLAVSVKWYERVHESMKRHGAFITNREAGIVCLLPVADIDKTGSSVLQLGLALQGATHISLQSLPYKRQSLSHGYGNILPLIANGDLPQLSSVYGLSPTWRVVHQLVGSGQLSIPAQETEFESFDLFWQSTEAKLASIVPDMDFWVGSHFLGVKTAGNPVSLHVLDVAVAMVSGAVYREQHVHHMRSSLWNEIQIRYLSEETLARSLMNQLSSITSGMVL